MSIYKRAWLYVKRNTKRTTLLCLLFTILCTISLLGFMLYSASTQAVVKLRENIGGYYTIQADADGFEQTGDVLANKVSSMEYISYWNGVDTYYMYAEGIDLVAGSNSSTDNVMKFMPKCIGCTNSMYHERFLTSNFQLFDGRHIHPDDTHKLIISKNVAELNDLKIGDSIFISVVDGIYDWQENANGTQIQMEIVGIYKTTYNEVVSPFTPECELQENIFFTDINTAKELFQIKFPNRSPEDYTYSSGIMFFLQDPTQMSEAISTMKKQSYADWDHLIITENNTAYEKAATPILKSAVLSKFILIAILIISMVIVSLVLLMWTRERMAEFGVLISLGMSGTDICKQILIENYTIALPSYMFSLVISALFSSRIYKLINGSLDIIRLDFLQATAIFVCMMMVIFMTSLLSSIPIIRKPPKEIFIDLS